MEKKSASNVLILANGEFPKRTRLLEKLRVAEHVICCDGAVEKLLNFGVEPNFIIGDMDSISEEHRLRFANIIVHNPDQETNDLTKAIHFCVEKQFDTVEILGATGLREDHTLGNISLLADYAQLLKSVEMFTDYGVFCTVSETTTFESFPNQSISIFCLTPETLITTDGLEYAVHDRQFLSWWQGTLNRAIGEQFTIAMNAGRVIVFRLYNNP